jgi:hypothetical protein
MYKKVIDLQIKKLLLESSKGKLFGGKNIGIKKKMIFLIQL